MSAPARTMLTFDVGANRFNYRVAGIALRHSHVLTCREDDDAYVMLPGGRVEMGEPSAVALAREIAEELRTTAVIGPLVFTVENFFARDGRRFHELAAYYRIELPAAFPFRPGGVVVETEDEGHVLSFEWAALDGDALARLKLLPAWMIGRLASLPPATEHLVMHEDPR